MTQAHSLVAMYDPHMVISLPNTADHFDSRLFTISLSFSVFQLHSLIPSFRIAVFMSSPRYTDIATATSSHSSISTGGPLSFFFVHLYPSPPCVVLLFLSSFPLDLDARSPSSFDDSAIAFMVGTPFDIGRDGVTCPDVQMLFPS